MSQPIRCQRIDAPEVCPYCASPRIFTVRCEFGPHYARTGCSDCQRHIKFNAAPWTLERARDFRLPFGRHTGRTVGELAGTKEGRSYLAWAAENVEGNAGTAAAIVLGRLAPEEAPT